MAVVQPSSGEVPVIPDGLYAAMITAAKAISLEVADQFGKTEKINISVDFEVEGEIFTLDPRVNQAWSEKATLFQIAQACGLDPNPQAAFDTDDLIGCQVKVLVETAEPGKWPRVTKWSRAGLPVRQTVAPKFGPDVSGFWEAAYAVEPDKAKVAALIKKLTGGSGITGMDQAQRDALLQEIRKASGVTHKHDAVYSEVGELVCRNCGEVLEEDAVPA